ncbi:Glucan endo-1 [Forsythia ovata]|uniref:Glucan endo-1 n=1 Tax=Forsythia ovata TaxID=205694 RepID=A0ABD1TAN3_9LAMI
MHTDSLFWLVVSGYLSLDFWVELFKVEYEAAAARRLGCSARPRALNYGTLGNNLPPPAQVAQFFKDKSTIDRIKIFDVNPDILRAFAGTRIFVTVTVPNG